MHLAAGMRQAVRATPGHGLLPARCGSGMLPAGPWQIAPAAESVQRDSRGSPQAADSIRFTLLVSLETFLEAFFL